MEKVLIGLATQKMSKRTMLDAYRVRLRTTREQLGDASIEIQAYTQALKKVEAQLVAHQQNQICQMSARDKAGLWYGDQMNKGVLSYENEVFRSLFGIGSSDIEDSLVNNRYAEGMHAVPPPMTGIYISYGPDKEIDDSQFIYGPKQSKPSESDARSSRNYFIYESDSDDEHVSLPSKEQETPSFANTIKHVKTPRQTVKQQNTCSKSPKPDKKDCSGLMSKKLGLGYGFTKKACFVCGSFSHLIRDCDFHEKRMAKQAEVNKRKCKGTGQRENRPVWNNVNRVNHQNQFVPTAVLTRTGKIQVNTARASSTNNVNTVRASSTKDVSTARHNFNSQAVPTNAARKVNTVKPIVNNVRPKTVFHKTYSPIRRPFNRTTTSRTKFSNQKVNTAVDYPQRALKNKWIVDSECSRHMTGNKAHLAEYQDIMVALLLLELPDENQVLLRVPRQNNMYSFNLENIVPFGGLACLIAKATVDESNKWHRRLGHVNFKNLNKLVKGNLVRGLPSKIFQNDHTCVACQKGKQHKASCKAKSLKNVPVPLDHFPINALTSKVLSFMVKKGKNFSGNVTPLFDSMLVQPTKDEGETSERPSESQPIPSPPHPSEDQPKSQPDSSLIPSPSIPIPDSNPEGSGGNHGGQSSSDRSLSGNEDGLTLQSVYDLCISLCKQKESVSKQGRKTAKSKTTAHKDQSFDDLDDFGAMDYMETEDAHNEKGVSTKDQVSTVKPDEGTDKPKVSTDKIDEGTAELKNGNSDENATPTATPTVFGDDETIAEFLARIKDDSILAARLQEKEKEKFIIEERAKLLHDTITAQKRFLTQQRAAKIRSRPPTRTQLRNQMMTYLKHVRGKKHSDMKTKNFEEIHVLYKKVKMSDENFIAISSAEDERRIKDVNKKATGIKKDDNIKEESKEKESTKKRKLGTRKKMKSRKRIFRQDASQDDQTDSEKESGELRLCLTIATDEDKEVDYEILDKKYPIIEWKTEYLGTKPQFDKTKRLEEINLNVIDDYVPITSDEDEFWNSQQDWSVKKYPLRRKVLLQTLELKLESEEDITMALELIRFVKKLIAELEPEDSDGNEEDL
ncbi:ribonuclease H-like domain-containing protein [Tanacetum coccineum]